MSQSGSISNLTPPPGTTLFLEGDVGGPVGPDGGGIIFVVGGDNVTVDGDPGTNTLTINTDGVVFTTTTTDATPTLIGSVVVSSGDAYMITCQFAALQDDQSAALGGTAFTVAYNNGVFTSLSGGGHKSIISNVASVPGECDITFMANGNDVDIYVIGATATTINWRMGISIFASS